MDGHNEGMVYMDEADMYPTAQQKALDTVLKAAGMSKYYEDAKYIKKMLNY